MSKAYLLVYINVEKFPPTVSEFRVTSEDAQSITRVTTDLIFTLHEVEAEDFHTASMQIIDNIRSSPWHRNLHPYFHETIGPRLMDKIDDHINGLMPLSAVVLGAAKDDS